MQERGEAMSEPKKEKEERLLVLCVDRDDDLGAKARIKTPVLGREENLNAAVSLALQDPEEPDANAIFEAVRVYDRLREKAGPREGHQIATISGSELVGVEADRKLVSELLDVLGAFPASGVILVTDGYTDEMVLPLVQSRVPVNSVRRIVMKHSKSIEETAAVFSRYLKLLLETPRYARIALGLPGVIIMVLSILLVFNLPQIAGAAFLIIVGSFLFVKGFGLEKVILDIYEWIRSYSPPPLSKQVVGFSSIAGALLIGIGSYQAAVYVAISVQELRPPPVDFGEWLGLLPKFAGLFIERSITLVVIGVCVLLSGGAIRWLLERDPRFWRTLVVIAVTAWSQQIFYEASKILINPEVFFGRFVITIVVGIVLAAVAALIAFRLHRKYAYFFEKREGS